LPSLPPVAEFAADLEPMPAINNEALPDDNREVQPVDTNVLAEPSVFFCCEVVVLAADWMTLSDAH
jgi:hypothetical protein